MRTEASSSVDVVVGRADEYERVKRILDKGRHPTFIGRTLVAHCAGNGGLLFFREDDEDAAVAIVNARKNVLLVLCVAPKHRSKGLGGRIIDFVKPNWVRAVESAVPWFETRGYVGIGEWKQGRSLRTRVMVRENVRRLAGRLEARLATTK